MHPVFQPINAGDRLEAAYLYANGHVIAVFRTGSVHYAKIAESIGVKPLFGAGRVAFYKPAVLAAASSLPNAEINVPSDDFGRAQAAEFKSDIGLFNIHPGDFALQTRVPVEPFVEIQNKVAWSIGGRTTIIDVFEED